MIRKRRLGYHSAEWNPDSGHLTIESPTSLPITMSAMEAYTLVRWLFGILDEIEKAVRRDEEGEGKP